MLRQEKILTALSKAVVCYKTDDCRDAALQAIAQGIDPTLAVMEGLAKGMEKAGELFDINEYFVPEVLMCAETLYHGLAILRPQIKVAPDIPKIKIVIGSVQGDIHDIGKNLVKLMFDAVGWEVYDLGCDVPLEAFVEKQQEVHADILALSAIMTTSMMAMKKIISMVKNRRPDCLVMIGGAPVTRDIAYFFGADGYAESAGKAVSEGLKMIARLDKYRNQAVVC